MEINAFEMEGDFKPKARQALREIPGKRLDYDQQDATNSEVVSKTDLETSFSGEELGYKRVSRLLGHFARKGSFLELGHPIVSGRLCVTSLRLLVSLLIDPNLYEDFYFFALKCPTTRIDHGRRRGL